MKKGILVCPCLELLLGLLRVFAICNSIMLFPLIARRHLIMLGHKWKQKF